MLVRGDAATEIIDYAKERKVDLIVAGSRGLSQVRGWLLGSVSRKLVHYAPCSVLIVKGELRANAMNDLQAAREINDRITMNAS